jgi:phage portal protein BeeE
VTILSRLFTGGERRDLFANSSIIPSVEHMAEMVGQDSATRLIAVFRANQLLADTISTLPVGVFTRVGDQRVPVDGPGWLEQPDPTDPSITLVEHFSQVMWSLGLDGTSFTLALPNVDDPAELHVLDPKRVTIRKRGEWIVRLDDGTEKLGADQIVQIDRSRRPGQLRGMSPIDEASTTLGTQQAASRFGSKVFRNGVYMSGYLAIPGTKDPAVLAQIKDEIESSTAARTR